VLFCSPSVQTISFRQSVISLTSRFHSSGLGQWVKTNGSDSSHPRYQATAEDQEAIGQLLQYMKQEEEEFQQEQQQKESIPTEEIETSNSQQQINNSNHNYR